MDRRGDHESVIAGGRYGNRRQRASQPLAAARRERQGQTLNGSLPFLVLKRRIWSPTPATGRLSPDMSVDELLEQSLRHEAFLKRQVNPSRSRF